MLEMRVGWASKVSSLPMAVRTGCLETGVGKSIFVVVFTNLASNLPTQTPLNEFSAFSKSSSNSAYKNLVI